MPEGKRHPACSADAENGSQLTLTKRAAPLAPSECFPVRRLNLLANLNLNFSLLS
jgi:hypothetical protein